ncbi:Macro domain protein [compost metagenome]
MSIKYFKGCVVDAFETGQYFFLLHQANCFNTMNSGVAKAIRERLPEAYASDCKTVKGDRNKLGTFSEAGIDSLSAFVINLYGQYNYGRDGKKYTQVDKLEQALTKFTEWVVVNERLICMPRMGCGLGGADWDTELVPMIERQLISRGFEVHVYDK